LAPGWTSRARSLGRVAWESGSAQISWRLPDLASITTIGASRAKDLAMSVTGTAPLRLRSSRGTRVTTIWPGLKPSERL
jgi:hypothetical protein